MSPDSIYDPATPIDLSACEKEQIQFLGAVQSFGHLVVISTDWVIQNISTNVGELLGERNEDLIGRKLLEVLPSQAVHDLRGKVQTLAGSNSSVRLFDVEIFEDEPRFDINLHRVGTQYIIEFERKTDPRGRDDLAMVQPLMERVRAGGTIERMCQIAARGVQAMTGFSRVMVYRFEDDFSGNVIAEAAIGLKESYLGLRFPAGDIPPQARALYKRSLLRIIPDVDAPISPIVPPTMPSGDPVDLSMAVTRAVSPIHLQYLRNMEVGASMSVSILREGELWGLIACHHHEARHVDFQTRSALELFAQLFAYELAHRQDRDEVRESERAHELHDRLVMMFEGGMDLKNSLKVLGDEIDDVIAMDGIALFSGDRYRRDGLTPNDQELDTLRKQLSRMPSNRVFTTDNISRSCPGAVAPERGIGGMMALPIKREPREYVMLFRREVAETVKWAGDPHKPVKVENGQLAPRQSFAIWQETVRGRSAPWTAAEARSGEILRVTLLELVLKLTSHSAATGRKRSDKQEILIAELNHRLRNVFTVMRGLVEQGGQAESPEQLKKVLAQRIDALSRSNDALRRGGEGGSLRALIEDSIRAFDGQQRLRVEGEDAQISASARDTMALVVHELVTNSVKYGALSVPEGEILCSFSKRSRGQILWTWQETGGPETSEPKRVGFGTTLISRAIPHELGGKAQVKFNPGGVEARFTLPASAAKIAPYVPPAPREDQAPETGDTFSDRDVLVVEDNFVIAMNASDALERMGARKVHLAGGIEDGLRMIDSHQIGFAVLDIDLGGESSEPIARHLSGQGIPFILASGYEAEDSYAAKFADHPVLAKPYSNESLASAIRAMRPRH